eukprot:GHUV01054415.1.p1 GENE.GHUV01054415.1~~GHUV01054415.1.p1  ORF type:complete len:125 (+),score=15.74 GHUV01054415.1:143-517(+)
MAAVAARPPRLSQSQSHMVNINCEQGSPTPCLQALFNHHPPSLTLKFVSTMMNADSSVCAPPEPFAAVAAAELLELPHKVAARGVTQKYVAPFCKQRYKGGQEIGHTCGLWLARIVSGALRAQL